MSTEKLIKKIRVKKEDETLSDYISIGVDVENVITKDGVSIEDKINQKSYYFNNIFDMKNANYLKVGDMAITLGYYEANDGGGAEYVIVNGSYIDNGGSYHKLNNNLFAELIINDSINIKQFGAKTGTLDSSFFIQNCIDFVTESYIKGKGYLIIIPAGKYTIANTIVLNYYTRVRTNGFVQLVSPSDATDFVMINIQEQPKLISTSYWSAGLFNSPILDGSNGGLCLLGNSNKGIGNLIGIKFGQKSETISTSTAQLHGVALKNIEIENFTVALELIPNDIYCNTFDTLDFHNNGIGIQYSDFNTANVNSGERISFLNSTWGDVAEAIVLHNSIPLQFHNCSFDMGGSVIVNYSNSGRVELYNCWIERNALVGIYNYYTYFPNSTRGIFVNLSQAETALTIYINDCYFTYGNEFDKLDDDFLIRGKIDLYIKNMQMQTAHNWGTGQGNKNTKGQLFLCSPDVNIHNIYDYKGYPKLSTKTTYNKNAQFEDLEIGILPFSGINTEIGEYIVNECYNPDRIASVEITNEDTLTLNGKSLKVTAAKASTCAFKMIHKDYQKIPENVNYMWADLYGKRDISGNYKKLTFISVRVSFFDQNHNVILEDARINQFDYEAQSEYIIPSKNQWFRYSQSNGYKIPDNAKYYKITYSINLLPTSSDGIVEIGDYGYISGLFVDFAK